jgi:hypothetical protein
MADKQDKSDLIELVIPIGEKRYCKLCGEDLDEYAPFCMVDRNSPEETFCSDCVNAYFE